MKCADMADAFDDGYKRGFNAAIDKAVEMVERQGFRSDINPLDPDYLSYIIEGLKKLKEV